MSDNPAHAIAETRKANLPPSDLKTASDKRRCLVAESFRWQAPLVSKLLEPHKTPIARRGYRKRADYELVKFFVQKIARPILTVGADYRAHFTPTPTSYQFGNWVAENHRKFR